MHFYRAPRPLVRLLFCLGRSDRVLLRSPRFTTTRRGLDLESIIKGVAPLDPAVATELRGVLAEGYLLDAEVDKARHWAEMVAADAERMDLPDAISTEFDPNDRGANP